MKIEFKDINTYLCIIKNNVLRSIIIYIVYFVYNNSIYNVIIILTKYSLRIWCLIIGTYY